jgi:hypothetical protein
LYYGQKQRFTEEQGTKTITKPKKSTLGSGISTLETDVKIKTGDNNYFDGLTTYEQKANKLFLELTAKINTQMDLDSNASITPDDTEKIKALNGVLATQLGDSAEFKAMIDDLVDIGYTINTDWQAMYNYYNTYLSYKSGLQFDSKSFDPNFLKQDLFLANGKEEEQTVLA